VKNVVLILLMWICCLMAAAANRTEFELNRHSVYVEEEVVSLCNALRVKKGLSPLMHNWEAARVARYKTEDMKTHRYFNHDSPVYGSFFDMLKNFHIPYRSAGENIAMGFATPQAVVDAWMASPSHRKNILSESFTQVGVGYSTDGAVHYWTLILLEP